MTLYTAIVCACMEHCEPARGPCCVAPRTYIERLEKFAAVCARALVHGALLGADKEDVLVKRVECNACASTKAEEGMLVLRIKNKQRQQ